MEIMGVSYPFSLGTTTKNKLPKQGGFCKRWVNINHDDWSAPVWKLALCKATLVDRSLVPKKYAYFDSDIAVMTEYEDPLLNMIIYDLAPAKSAVFNIQNQPPLNIELAYNWTSIGAINIQLNNKIPMIRNPIYPALGVGGVIFFTQYLMSILNRAKDNL